MGQTRSRLATPTGGGALDESRDDHRSANRQWFTDAFDPPANLEALAGARRFGRRTAEELADRFLTEVGRPGRAAPADTPAEDWDALARRLREDVVRAGEAGMELLDDALALVALALSRAGRPADDRSAGSLELSAAAGGVAVGVFWVHNTSPAPVPEVRPHCGPLRSHTGRELAPETLQFDPPALEPLPGRSSCGIEVRCAPPSGAVPGRYVSALLATGVPDLHLPIAVTVTGADEGP
jgi:hypothetical protein